MVIISPFITIILCFQKFRYHMGIKISIEIKAPNDITFK